MKLFGNDSRGYIHGIDIIKKGRGFQWTRKSKSRDLRPGPKHIPDTALVELGKRYVAGEGVILLARELGMSRKTAYRWIKRLGLGRYKVA